MPAQNWQASSTTQPSNCRSIRFQSLDQTGPSSDQWSDWSNWPGQFGFQNKSFSYHWLFSQEHPAFCLLPTQNKATTKNLLWDLTAYCALLYIKPQACSIEVSQEAKKQLTCVPKKAKSTNKFLHKTDTILSCHFILVIKASFKQVSDMDMGVMWR